MEIVALFFKQNKESEIETQLDLDPELNLVNIDSGKVEQIILNLIMNAKDAMPNGGRLTITTKNILKRKISTSIPKKYVNLSIEDTGTGMSSEIIDKIFEPFFTTKGSKGTGLGLPLVKKIVEEYNGWIDVSSKIDEGTVFKIYLHVKD